MNESDEDNFLAIAPNSTSTGIGCDFLILDDTIKNKYEAYHKELKRKIFEDWFRDTLYSRLEGKRKIIVCMTRWATDDIAGRLMEMFDETGRKYRLITKKAFDKTRVNNEEIARDFKEKYNIINYDQLVENIDKLNDEDKDLAYYYLDKAMLNPKQLDYRQYQNVLQTIGEDIVDANYNQEPLDKKGCLYTSFLEYDPAEIKTIDNSDGKVEFTQIRARADTADEGEDYLCMIIYGVTKDKQAYVLDIYYTQDPMEVTEKKAAEKLLEYNVDIFRPESNNGGRGWARAVDRIYKELGGVRCITKWYHQELNKEARILSNAPEVMRLIHFPYDWKHRYREYYQSMKEYQRQGKNEHDDAEDCTTSIAEELSINRGIRGA